MSHFTLKEFTRSQAATRLGIKNDLPPDLLPRWIALRDNVLEPARLAMGPILITSGYRCEFLNINTPGSASKSQHTKGEAADLEPIAPNVTTADLLRYIYEHLPFDQLIWEYGGAWVHVSYVSEEKNRRSVLEAVRVPGKKAKYLPLSHEQIMALRVA